MTEQTTANTETPAAAAAPVAPAAKRRFGKPLLAGVAAAVILAAGVFGAAAYADKGDRHGGRHKGGPMGGFMIERMLDRVDATEEQRTKIKAILDKARADMDGLRGERRAVMEDLTTVLKAPTVDRGVIEQKRAERLAKVDAASKQMTAAFADIAEVLTPEQRKIVAALIEDRAERGGRRGKGEGRGWMRHGSADDMGEPPVAPTAN